MDPSHNPYGLSQAELNWFHGIAGSQHAPNIPQLQAERNAAKARVEKIQSSIRTGDDGIPRTIEPEFLADGRFALSEPEQQWAMGGPSTSTATSLSEQLVVAKQQLYDLELQLSQLQHGSELN